MIQRIRFCVGYFLFWMGFFAALRLTFLLYHHSAAGAIGLGNIMRTFWYGARMDMAGAAYLSLLVFILTAISVFLPRIASRLILVFSLVAFVLIALLATIDIEVFRAWGYHADGAILQYFRTPREMFASAGASPIALLILIFLSLACLSVFLFLRWFWPAIRAWKPMPLPINLLAFVLLGGLSWSLYYPGKGGFQPLPITQSTVYFSHDAFANQAALNVAWNFFDSIFWQTYRTDNPYRVMADSTASRVADSLLATEGTETARLLRTNRPNVIVIIWESFTAKVVQRLGGVPGVTPHIDSLSHEGVLFTHFYATGDRSPEGLTGVISGYPAQPTTEIIQHPRKSSSLPALPRTLARLGYRSRFYYGGDPEFTNFKSFVLQAGFDTLITKDDFDPRDRHSSWGADDHVVLGRLLQDTRALQRPFFVTLFTLSSHEPFKVPMETVIPGDDERSLFLNSHAYTDRSIGEFIRRAKLESWWDSTLIIVVADHGHRLPVLDSLQPTRKWETFAIPMLWLGGALAVRDTVIETVGVQTDIPATLLAQMRLDGSPFRWSRNLLARDVHPWGWFTFTDGFGWVNGNGDAVAWDDVGQREIAHSGTAGAEEIRAGRAMLQTLISDYIKR